MSPRSRRMVWGLWEISSKIANRIELSKLTNHRNYDDLIPRNIRTIITIYFITQSPFYPTTCQKCMKLFIYSTILHITPLQPKNFKVINRAFPFGKRTLNNNNNNNNTIFIQVTRFSLMKLLSVWDLLKAKVKFIHEFRK